MNLRESLYLQVRRGQVPCRKINADSTSEESVRASLSRPMFRKRCMHDDTGTDLDLTLWVLRQETKSILGNVGSQTRQSTGLFNYEQTEKTLICK